METIILREKSLTSVILGELFLLTKDSQTASTDKTEMFNFEFYI